MQQITLKTVIGRELEQYIDDMARLRISVFREFPYLYDGDMDYERNYLQTYQQCDEAAIVIALDAGNVIGGSSCLPMRHETAAFKQPFLAEDANPDHPLSIDTLFYCAESVLDKRYRGIGLGVAFFNYREAYARALGGFTHLCFCGVDRPDDHPLRPAAYQPLDKFWNKRGFNRLPDKQARLSWKDIDQPASTEKTLTFWLKVLA